MTSKESLLFVIRHAESEANVSRTFASRIIDPPLSPNGLKDAERIAERLVPEGIKQIYTSPFRRALQTAEAVASKCHHPLTLLPDLREVNVGILDGKSARSEENWERYERVVKRWSAGDLESRFQGGESLEEVCKRARGVLQILDDGTDFGPVVLISHAVFLMVFLPLLLNDFPTDLERYTLPRGSITTVVIRNAKTQLLELGSIEHLRR